MGSPRVWDAITRVSRTRSCVKDMATSVMVEMVGSVLCNALRIMPMTTRCSCYFPTENLFAGLNLFLSLQIMAPFTLRVDELRHSMRETHRSSIGCVTMGDIERNARRQCVERISGG